MAFVEEPSTWSRYVGFIGGYVLFTTMLFFILVLLQKIPFFFSSYFKIMLLTIAITILGIWVKKLLK